MISWAFLSQEVLEVDLARIPAKIKLIEYIWFIHYFYQWKMINKQKTMYDHTPNPIRLLFYA